MADRIGIVPKRISILGSTGSIGASTLDVVRRSKGRLSVEALAAGRNVDRLVAQVEEFRPKVVSVGDEETAAELRRALKQRSAKAAVVFGESGHVEVATAEKSAMVVSAMSGTHGLVATYRAIEARKDIALANKEILVSAGELFIEAAREFDIQLLPVDSEHSAVWQCLQGNRKEAVQALHLTASGGPFRTLPIEKFREITPEQALNHPTWKMGKKITIDSATMMNKGLEVIEARWLFDVPPERIKIVVHPQSIVHSLVEYVDGSFMAQLGLSDMRGPISYALYYPERVCSELPVLSLAELGQLTFEEPDFKKFGCLDLAFRALKEGHAQPLILNVVNEEAVYAFLDGRIRFPEIPVVCGRFMDRGANGQLPEDIERIASFHGELHRAAKEFIGSYKA